MWSTLLIRTGTAILLAAGLCRAATDYSLIDAIKRVGTTETPIRIYAGLTARISVVVYPEGQQPPAIVVPKPEPEPVPEPVAVAPAPAPEPEPEAEDEDDDYLDAEA